MKKLINLITLICLAIPAMALWKVTFTDGKVVDGIVHQSRKYSNFIWFSSIQEADFYVDKDNMRGYKANWNAIDQAGVWGHVKGMLQAYGSYILSLKDIQSIDKSLL